ncbi:hypothetical protein PanWU01x14_039370 [Parasponia andersonii]|uniref:Uncharacterized protein n=1 Tax=Parasponia andersonii TaxID=3476 RepID=A0A2P5DQW6_PARAD|nr:hypothetical protein PanWU01x14_039370 [Parasponia andersonii]
MDSRSDRLDRLGSVMDSALNSEDPHADVGITCDPRDPSHGSRLGNGPGGWRGYSDDRRGGAALPCRGYCSKEGSRRRPGVGRPYSRKCRASHRPHSRAGSSNSGVFFVSFQCL